MIGMPLQVARTNLIIQERQIFVDTALQVETEGSRNKIEVSNLKINSSQLEASGSGTVDLLLRREKLNLLGSDRIFDTSLIGLNIQQEILVKQGSMEILGNYLGAEESDGLVDGIVSFRPHQTSN